MSLEKILRSIAAGGLAVAVIGTGIGCGANTQKPAPAPAATAEAKPAVEPAKAEAPKPRPAAAQPALPILPAPEKATAPAAAKADNDDHTTFGGTPGRNMVNLMAKNVPAVLPVGEEKKDGVDAVEVWHADLGSRAYGGPIIAGGKVFVGTNNERPRNPRDQRKTPDGEVEPIDKGILMCFDEKTGAFLWQAVHDKLPSGQVHDWPKEGLCSTPAVEGNRIYYVTNRCTVVCADVDGLKNGNDGVKTEKYKTPTDADVVWEFDMMGDLNVFPHNMSASSPLIVGDLIFVTTGNGVDENHINIPSVDAPSFLALNKATGKPVWKSDLPGKNIMHGQWSNPVYAEVKGVKQVIFPGGDGWLYAFDPPTGKPLWKFDCNPKDSKYELGGTGTRSDFIGTPVVYDEKVYIGVGQDPEHFTGVGHFWCIDPSKASTGNTDLSPRDTAFDPKDPKNKESGLVWHYGGADARKFVPRDFVFGRTMSTASIVDGVLYIAELQGYVHCLDAKTGKKFWQYDTKGAIWGSTYYADGKVFLATEGGDLFVFKHEKTPKVIDEVNIPDAKDEKDFRAKMLAKRKQVEAAYLLAKNEFDAPIRSTVVEANGQTYVMTEKSLYVFKKK